MVDLVAELGTRADQLELPGKDVPVPDPARIGAVPAQYGIVPPPGS